jgi:hypothetical protein
MKEDDGGTSTFKQEFKFFFVMQGEIAHVVRFKGAKIRPLGPVLNSPLPTTTLQVNNRKGLSGFSFPFFKSFQQKWE